MQGLLAELKRRKVIRAAFTYLAAAWAVLQVADLFFPMLGLPEWSMTLVLLIAALGFPVAMGMAWAFEFHLKSGSVVITEEVSSDTAAAPFSFLPALQLLLIFLLLALVAYLYYDRLFSAPEGAQPVDRPSTITRNSIAVLPFEDMSEEGDHRYFSDGISEELLNALAQLEHLQVAARTSSFSLRGSNKDALAIGQALNVATLLEGSVRKDGNYVRVTAQLIDTSNGFHLWSETYDKPLEDIFALQDDISRQVVDAILPMITGEVVYPMGPTTSSVEAYNEYLKGRALLREPRADRILQQAREKFAKATRLDPQYAEAWAGLCDALLADYRHNNRSNVETFLEGEKACGVALTRSTSNRLSLDVYIALGVLYREAGEFDKSLEALRNAKKLSPDSIRTLKELGITYAAASDPGIGGQGEYSRKSAEYLGKAEQYLRSAVELNVGSWASYLALGNFYFDTEAYDKALEAYDHVLTLHPGATDALINKASALEWLGEEAESEAMWALAIDQSLALENYGALGLIYRNLGGLYYYRGDFDAALLAYQDAEQYRQVTDHVILGRIAETQRAQGNKAEEQQTYATAIELAEKALPYNPRNWETLGLLAIYHGFSGNEEKSRGYIEAMEAQGRVDPVGHYFAALAYWSFRDTEAAYEQLALASAQESLRGLLQRDPDLKQLRALDEQRFDAIVGQRAD